MNKKGETIILKDKNFLFDFDGVISQSSYALFEAWSFAFRKISGINIKEEEFHVLEGVGVQKTAGTLADKYNVHLPSYQDIIDLKDDYFKENHKFTVFRGVYELIDFLRKRGRKIALVTGAKKYRILETTPKNFIDKFNALVTSDDVSHTKPHPEPYLKAAELLKVNLKDCIVVENSPVGIQAAKGAGIYVIALKTTLSEEFLSQADLILGSITDLLKLLEEKEANL